MLYQCMVASKEQKHSCKKQRTQRHVEILAIVLKNKYVKSSNNWVVKKCWYGIFKKWENVLRFVVVGLLDLRACGPSDVTTAERRGVFGDLQLSRFLQSGEEESKCGWCVVLSFALLSLSQSWSSSLLVVCLLFIWLRCQEIWLLYRFSLLIGSKWVFFVFYREDHGLAEKLLLIILIFDEFHRHFAMRWSYPQKPLFPFWRKSQHR